MARLTAAEKQRLYRQRRDADPVRRAEYLQKKQQTYVKNIQCKKRLRIGDLSERGKRTARKNWRIYKADYRARKHRESQQGTLTPPDTPLSSDSPRRIPNTSRQKIHGKNKIHRERRQCYRQLKKLQHKLEMEGKKAAKYKTKCARLKKKMLKRNPQSPTTKTINILKGSNASSLVKKTLRFHFSLLSEIKSRYSASKKERVKQIYARLICGKLIKKYKLQAFCQKQIGFSYKRWKTCGRELDFIRQKNIISQGLRSTVKQFFLRDDVSRVVTGKKNTVTVRKIKKQRRILCDTMVHLHKKFTAEHKHVSYSFFCAQRPFWVTQPKEADRDTCLCKTHENLQYMADKLFSLGILIQKSGGNG
ncbi:uncharacterized protein LOC125263172 [Megalobrama amblycephala]|uniref:uncharacterized protein LOC125263172 n=1 Tax=Megalobrama amblycephala TaxID=75352 RepID=UPI00201471E3|nr:uncharacterized protein LOC125263172 [Megalobrama amblycephala]